MSVVGVGIVSLLPLASSHVSGVTVPFRVVRVWVTWWRGGPGASEIVLKCSSGLLWPDNTPGKGEQGNVRLVPKTPQRAQYLNDKVIEAMATQSLRTLGLAYR